MHQLVTITLADVQRVYSGAEGRLWELLMGEQIHIGGLCSSQDLAERAHIKTGSRGVDLCCCTGAGMRFLVRFRNVAAMQGVDATAQRVDLGRSRCQAEGLDTRIEFVLAEAIDTGLPGGAVDFVWGEDAWCYVADKPALIAEAARLVRPGGVIAFTDWCQGPSPLNDEQAKRFLSFMKFPSLASLQDYRRLLQDAGCHVIEAADTGRFPEHADLYIQMVEKQLTFDALQLIGFDQSMLAQLGVELHFVRQLAHDRKLIQGRFIARKREVAP
ncbi:MAG: methyltransferase domain-containing protein [Phycisphaeraceae bacterium]|nr:methyltransferase domain-containing protein [Phycisphaeraceae bacterium]